MYWRFKFVPRWIGNKSEVNNKTERKKKKETSQSADAPQGSDDFYNFAMPALLTQEQLLYFHEVLEKSSHHETRKRKRSFDSDTDHNHEDSDQNKEKSPDINYDGKMETSEDPEKSSFSLFDLSFLSYKGRDSLADQSLLHSTFKAVQDLVFGQTESLEPGEVVENNSQLDVSNSSALRPKNIVNDLFGTKTSFFSLQQQRKRRRKSSDEIYSLKTEERYRYTVSHLTTDLFFNFIFVGVQEHARSVCYGEAVDCICGGFGSEVGGEISDRARRAVRWGLLSIQERADTFGRPLIGYGASDVLE